MAFSRSSTELVYTWWERFLNAKSEALGGDREFSGLSTKLHDLRSAIFADGEITAQSLRFFPVRWAQWPRCTRIWLLAKASPSMLPRRRPPNLFEFSARKPRSTFRPWPAAIRSIIGVGSCGGGSTPLILNR